MQGDFFLGIPNLIHIFSKAKKETCKEILIENIKAIDMMENNLSALEIDYVFKENSNKKLLLEFQNPSLSLLVLAKIRYLLYKIIINFLLKNNKFPRNHINKNKKSSSRLQLDFAR